MRRAGHCLKRGLLQEVVLDSPGDWHHELRVGVATYLQIGSLQKADNEGERVDQLVDDGNSELVFRLRVYHSKQHTLLYREYLTNKEKAIEVKDIP